MAGRQILLTTNSQDNQYGYNIQFVICWQEGKGIEIPHSVYIPFRICIIHISCNLGATHAKSNCNPTVGLHRTTEDCTRLQNFIGVSSQCFRQIFSWTSNGEFYFCFQKTLSHIYLQLSNFYTSLFCLRCFLCSIL